MPDPLLGGVCGNPVERRVYTWTVYLSRAAARIQSTVRMLIVRNAYTSLLWAVPIMQRAIRRWLLKVRRVHAAAARAAQEREEQVKHVWEGVFEFWHQGSKPKNFREQHRFIVNVSGRGAW